jgi:hypothetical protein
MPLGVRLRGVRMRAEGRRRLAAGDRAEGNRQARCGGEKQRIWRVQ